MNSFSTTSFETSGSEETSAPPQVFVRTFAVPPGPPWMQVRAAQLEVRHGAPLALNDLLHRLKRLESWRISQPARFAALYIRRSDYKGPFETTVTIDGKAVAVAFGGKSRSLDAVKDTLLVGALGAFTVVALGAAVVTAVGVRQETAARLDALESTATARVRWGQLSERQHRQNSAVSRARQGAGEAADVIESLNWIARVRATDAQILAVHWDNGLVAVEARGERSPISSFDREIIRSPRAVRPGVWLWGVRAPDPESRAPRP